MTTLVDATPDHRSIVPGPSLSPLGATVVTAVTFIGGMFTPWALPVGLLLALPVLVTWFWPRKPHQLLHQEGQP